MERQRRVPVVDGHNDVLARVAGLDGEAIDFLERNETGHLDLVRAQDAGLAAGFFAVFVPSPEEHDDGPDLEPDPPSGQPYAPSIDRGYAVPIAKAMTDALFELERRSEGRVCVVRSSEDLAAAVRGEFLGAILHFEGAEPIDTALSDLGDLYDRGLRSLGIVWSRANAFAHGVPFGFASSPDIGPGLSAAGRELVRECNSLGILVDLSHLNEQGFWDVARLSDRPLVASHSNAHALCASTRNLTDRQLDAIGESGGLVGLNFAVKFLRPDGRGDEATPVGEIARHARYIAERIGVEHVALGSDFDGARIPVDLGGVAGLPLVLDALVQTGFQPGEIDLIAHGNWMRVLEQTWK